MKDGLQLSGIANVQSPAPPQTIHVDLKISSEQAKYGSQRLFKVKINRTAQNGVINILFLDALASLDLKLSVSQSVSDSPFSDFQ